MENPVSDENFNNRLTDARIVFEETHGITLTELAELTGIPRRMLVSQRKAEDWRKNIKEGQSEAAAAAVERFKEWNSAVAKLEQAQAAAVDSDETGKPLVTPLLENALHELIERHKREWAVMRQITYEAVQERTRNPVKANERARLGKLLSETLDIIQKGERRAWGLENGDDPTKKPSVVVIERD